MRTNKALKALKFGNIKHQILIKDCLDQGHRLLNQQNGLVSFHFRYCSTLDIVFPFGDNTLYPNRPDLFFSSNYGNMEYNGYENLGTRFGEFPGNFRFIVFCIKL